MDKLGSRLAQLVKPRYRMVTYIAVCLILGSTVALGAAILVHYQTQHTRRALAREQRELAGAVEQANEQIAAERHWAKEDIASDVRRARKRIAEEQDDSQKQLELLSAQIQRTRSQLVALQQEASSFQHRYAEYDQTVSRLCSEIECTLPVFVTVLERTPTVDAELIRQVYLLNDRFVKIRTGLVETRGLFEKGVVRRQSKNWGESGWPGPQGHLSAQWHD